MSAHRQHYIAPTPQQQQRDRGPALIGLLACVVLMIGASVASILHTGLPSTAATVTPVHQAQATGCAIAPLATPAAAP